MPPALAFQIAILSRAILPDCDLRPAPRSEKQRKRDKGKSGKTSCWLRRERREVSVQTRCPSWGHWIVFHNVDNYRRVVNKGGRSLTDFFRASLVHLPGACCCLMAVAVRSGRFYFGGAHLLAPRHFLPVPECVRVDLLGVPRCQTHLHDRHVGCNPGLISEAQLTQGGMVVYDVCAMPGANSCSLLSLPRS